MALIFARGPALAGLPDSICVKWLYVREMAVRLPALKDLPVS